MKQILVISGKGGTGKTVITASLASLFENKIIADCDVDAADLHLLLHPRIKQRHQFSGLAKAWIDPARCTGCGECVKVCRFGAISQKFEVDPISCEGCRVCMFKCPVNAIIMKENRAGEYYISETQYGIMVHAKLGIAEENSGRLVSTVRQKAKEYAEKNKADYIIIDGPPGIGCPVIASLAGVDLAVVVMEPSLSGIQDAQRVSDVAKHFGIRVACVINKYDINLENTELIENWCRENNLPLLGKFLFDPLVSESIVQGRPLVEYCDNDVARQVKEFAVNLKRFLSF
ncbi:(4Fe-4S)-binding protein [candidate division WOR-3 bacterium 4484_100]|uniref:(4Fe-4S)-binding protein n=1 Tax=candidate division WOR-3 bacterium 4484_100 TaxID=1936077 RepID=A0A1V4QFD9_UNCW3|nr:MAG: (4Fe-4S)-binding protein [candidate division WOR-3 bacterium 4484_100]